MMCLYVDTVWVGAVIYWSSSANCTRRCHILSSTDIVDGGMIGGHVFQVWWLPFSLAVGAVGRLRRVPVNVAALEVVRCVPTS